MCVLYVFIVLILPGSCQEFLVVTHDGVTRHGLGGGHKQLALVKDMVKDLDYHHARGELYLLTFRQILRTSLQGPASQQMVPLVDPEDEYLLTALAVDWVHHTLYWLSGAVLVLHSSALDGTNPRVIYRALYVEEHMNKLFVDPYVGRLFWMTNNEVHTSDLQGGDVRRNVFPSLGSVRSLALDPSDTRVYLLTAAEGRGDAWRLVSCGYDGTGLRTLAGAPSVIYGLGGLHGRVYWVPHEDDSCVWVGNDDYRYRFSVYASSGNGTKPTHILSISEHVWNFRIYHQDLQSQKVTKAP